MKARWVRVQVDGHLHQRIRQYGLAQGMTLEEFVTVSAKSFLKQVPAFEAGEIPRTVESIQPRPATPAMVKAASPKVPNQIEDGPIRREYLNARRVQRAAAATATVAPAASCDEFLRDAGVLPPTNA
jgi:hypothetical protein